MVLEENRHIAQWDRIDSLVINLCLYSQFNYKEGDKYTQWRKGSLFNTLFWENCINLDSILKSRDITLPTKVHLVKAMVLQRSCMDVRVEL